MQLPLLNSSPEKAAIACNTSQFLNKILTEALQLIGCALWAHGFADSKTDASLPHSANHKCAIWVRHSQENFEWTVRFAAKAYELYMQYIRRQCVKCSGYKTGHETSHHKLAFAQRVVDRLKSGDLHWPPPRMSFKAELLKLHAPLVRRIARTTDRAKKLRSALSSAGLSVNFESGCLVVPAQLSSIHKKQFATYKRLIDNFNKMRNKLNDDLPLEIKHGYTSFPEGCSSAAVAIERNYLQDPRCIVFENEYLNVTKTYAAYHNIKHPSASAPWHCASIAPVPLDAPRCSCASRVVGQQ